MDSVHRQKELLEKYWNGETTLQEEQELKTLVNLDDSNPMSTYFKEFDSLKEAEIDLDVKSIIGMQTSEIQKPTIILRTLKVVQKSWSYAAAVTLLLIGFWAAQNMQTTIPQVVVLEETYDNPDKALEQTEAALAYLMSKMKHGQNKTLDNVKRIEALDIVIPQ